MLTSYLACDLNAKEGRISLGTLDRGRLNISELRRFDNVPVQERDSWRWDISQLFQHILDSLAEVARTDETVNGVACSSWGDDYLLFDANGALMESAAVPSAELREKGMEELFKRVSREEIYDETGLLLNLNGTLSQLSAEKPKRLAKAGRLMPVADGFNFLLSNQARVETTAASLTQLFNPMQKAWSGRLIEALHLPSTLLPPIVPSGTVLGPLRDDIATQTCIEDVEVVSSCSNEMAAAIAGIPVEPDVNWAFLKLGTHSLMGTEITEPIVHEIPRELGYTNELGYGGTVRFARPTVGLWILEECQRYWSSKGEEVDWDMMMHLAASSPPFESLINPADAMFQAPGDMPAKIKAFCRSTNQPVIRKPGAIIRCVLESIALYYRRMLKELEMLSGQPIDRLYILGGGPRHPLLDNFIANAIQIPVVICGTQTNAAGNIIVQAMALGHLQSLEEGRSLVRETMHCETVKPYAGVWDDAYQRLENLT